MHKAILLAILFIITSLGCSLRPNPSVTPLTPEDTQHLILSHLTESNAEFTPNTVHLVDYHTKTKNFIFRGNTPLINNIFAYDQLMQTIKHKANHPLKGKPFLIVVSLMNNITETQELSTEAKFFKQNPDKGMLVNHPIYGALTNPHNYPEKRRKEIEKTPGIDNISQLVDNIKSMIDKKSERSSIIYVHCQEGYDRTGEVIASYQMRYSHFSYEHAYSNANKIAERLISNYSQAALQWYAYYLKDVKEMNTIGEIH